MKKKPSPNGKIVPPEWVKSQQQQTMTEVLMREKAKPLPTVNFMEANKSMYVSIRHLTEKSLAIEPLGDEYGGKAVMLSKLIAKGIPVPRCAAVDGVAVYRLWSSFYRDDGMAVKVAYHKFFESLKAALHYVSEGIKFLPIAVRSSAIGEDGTLASFAGRYESVLGVYSSSYEIGEAITKIIRSADSERVLSYMTKNGMTQKGVGIIIQRMIEPSHSAIVFTRNPIDGTDEIVIEIASGLGEGLVGGTTSPAMFAAQLAQDGGVTFESTGGIEGLPPAPDLAGLVYLAKECEVIVGGPADIEAAYDGVMWWILQARPITTLE